jgi:RNA-directed DNA polymerase
MNLPAAGWCKLRLNEEKTKVVYCQDYRRAKRKKFGSKFDFLGFSFKPRSMRCSVKTGQWICLN